MTIQQERKIAKKILRFLAYSVIIPLLIIVLLLFMYGLITGENIFEMARDYFDERSRIDSIIDENQYYKQQLAKARDELESNEGKIADLEQQLEEKNEEIKQLELEKDQLASQLDEENFEAKGTDNSIQAIVSSFHEMKPKNAANILVQLDEGLAVNILSAMDDDSRAKVLEKMPPENAAKITAQLASE